MNTLVNTNNDKHVCKYAVIRFRPCLIKNEFVNIGVVLFDIDSNLMGLKVIGDTEIDRLQHFFRLNDDSLYKQAILTIKSKLRSVNTIESFAVQNDGLVTFSEIGVTFSSNFNNTLDELYDSMITT